MSNGIQTGAFGKGIFPFDTTLLQLLLHYPPLAAILSFNPSTMRKTKSNYIWGIDSPFCRNIFHTIDVCVWKIYIPVPEGDVNLVEMAHLA